MLSGVGETWPAIVQRFIVKHHGLLTLYSYLKTSDTYFTYHTVYYNYYYNCDLSQALSLVLWQDNDSY